jgi:hypothetical protein
MMVEGQPPLPAAADGHGDAWRVGHDINAAWLSMLSLVDIGSGRWPYARPGFFNDLEMMELGNGDFIAEQGGAALARARAHMTCPRRASRASWWRPGATRGTVRWDGTFEQPASVSGYLMHMQPPVMPNACE